MRRMAGHALRGARRGAIAILIGLAAAGAPAAAQRPTTTAQTLLDRIQIEDLIVDYYYNLGGGDAKLFGDYYAEGAEFDINGKVYRGGEAIEGVYRALAQTSPTRRGTFHMLLNNPRIVVRGATATAEFIWTGVISDTVKAPPRLMEQGREYDILIKQGGAWRIKKRVIISDAALQDEFDTVYTPRKNYDPAKDM